MRYTVIWKEIRILLSKNRQHHMIEMSKIHENRTPMIKKIDITLQKDHSIFLFLMIVIFFCKQRGLKILIYLKLYNITHACSLDSSFKGTITDYARLQYTQFSRERNIMLQHFEETETAASCWKRKSLT